MKEQLEFYQENGYLVIPDVLSREQVDTLNRVIDQDQQDRKDQRQHPPFWIEREEGHTRLNVHMLLAHPEFDITARTPALLSLLEEIMGPEVCAEEHSVRIREPYDGEPYCHWHRDASGPQDKPPYWTRYISVVFYLTEVNDTTHSFSVLPGSAQSTERPALEEYDLDTADHIVGTAGTAILFNAAMFHAGNVRRTTAQRRTIHIYCGRTSDKTLSNFTIFPRRLWQGKDAATQKYYSKQNPITKMLLDNF